MAAVPSIPQRRAMRLPRRTLKMNRFAFLAAGVATAAIALMAVAGGGLLNPSPPTIASQPPQSSPGPSPAASPSASPSLAHNGVIALVRSGAVVLVDPITGETVRTLVEAPGSDTDPYAATDLSWSPDGRSLAYVSREGPIFVIDITTGASKQILGCGREIAACAIAWSPDGRSIAVAHQGELELIDPSGGHQQTLYSFGGSVGQPTWSPDWLGSRRSQRLAVRHRSRRVGHDQAHRAGSTPRATPRITVWTCVVA